MTRRVDIGEATKMYQALPLLSLSRFKGHASLMYNNRLRGYPVFADNL